MHKNLGSKDRWLRLIFGLIFLALAYFDVVWAGILLGALGVIAVLESIFGWCGIYHMLGISTKREEVVA